MRGGCNRLGGVEGRGESEECNRLGGVEGRGESEGCNRLGGVEGRGESEGCIPVQYWALHLPLSLQMRLLRGGKVPDMPPQDHRPREGKEAVAQVLWDH